MNKKINKDILSLIILLFYFFMAKNNNGMYIVLLKKKIIFFVILQCLANNKCILFITAIYKSNQVGQLGHGAPAFFLKKNSQQHFFSLFSFLKNLMLYLRQYYYCINEKSKKHYIKKFFDLLSQLIHNFFLTYINKQSCFFCLFVQQKYITVT